MTQPQSSSNPSPSAPLTPQSASQPARAVIPIHKRVDGFLSEGSSILDAIGKRLCGELWQPVCESFQDAIALSLLATLPSLISHWLTGQDYSGFDTCMKDSSWLSVNRYACFVIVTADLTGWIVLAGRVLQRFIRALQPRRGRNAGRS